MKVEIDIITSIPKQTKIVYICMKIFMKKILETSKFNQIIL